MNATNFLQNVRRSLVPMRTATIDAFLLGSLIAIILIYTGVVLTFPLLLILAYALVYLIAVILRLRQAANQTTEPKSPYNYHFH